MDIQTEFTEKFYTFWNAAPVAQSKKNFNTLINDIDNKITDENVRSELIANLEPRNKLEISFKIELLMRYQMYDKVLEILKSTTNSLYTSNILKRWTFFKETFKKLTPNELVDDILPNLSYSTRMKVLNRIFKNLFDEKLAEEYFDSIANKYEVVSASVMLGCCSIPFIKEKMERYNVILTFKQVQVILRKDTTFLDYYFERIQSNSKVKMCDKIKLLKLIFKSDEQLFWRLSEKYKIVSNCGRRLTKKIIKQHEHLLTDKHDEYPVNLKRRIMYQVWKKKHEIFKSFIKNNSPEDINWYFLGARRPYHYSIFADYYRYISRDRQYNFLNYAFKERFGCNIHDKLELLTENILLLMPQELRDNILEVQIEENEDLFNIYRPEISFPTILDKIKRTSDMNRRTSLVDKLLRSCACHKNADYLLKTLQYCEKRHRNDTQVLQTCLNGLKFWINLETLSTEHWTYIDNIQKLINAQTETVNKSYLLGKQIGHLINNNLDIDEHLRRYLEMKVQDYYLYDIFVEIPKHKKYCLLQLKKYIDEIKDTNISKRFTLNYLNIIHRHNIYSPEDKVPLTHFMPIIKSLSEEYLSDLLSLIIFYIKFSYTDFNPIIWQHPTKFFLNKSLFSWYLQHHKNEILDKFDLILPILSAKTHKTFIYSLDEYSYRHISEITTNFCINRVEHATDVQQKINAIDILSIINQTEFLRISAEFKPSEDGKIDPSYPAGNIELLAAVLSNLKKLLYPPDGLNIISKFCKGDYLKYALGPVYSIISKTPERIAKTFLKELHNSAVSARKHTLHMSKTIYSFDEFCKFIKDQAVSERNPSLKTILFKKSLEYAQVMPVEKCWELLKMTMHGIDNDDEEAHNLLLELGKVPKQYRVLYIPEAYNQLGSNKDPSINRKKFQLLSLIPKDVIDELSQDQLQSFLSEILFTDKVSGSNTWTNLVFYSTGSKQKALLDYVLQKFEAYHKLNPNTTVHNKWLSFLSPLCEEILKFQTDAPFVQKLSNVWFNSFSPELDVSNRVYLSCIVAYAECDYNLQTVVPRIHALLEEYLATYSSYLLNIFENSLYSFLSRNKFEDRFLFIKKFLGDLSSVPVCLVAIRLLSSYFDIPNDRMNDYFELVRKIKERPELCVRTYLYNNLSSKYQWLFK